MLLPPHPIIKKVTALKQTLKSALIAAAKRHEADLCAELEQYASRRRHRFGRVYRENKRRLLATVNGTTFVPRAVLRRRVLIPLIAVLIMLVASMNVQAIREPVISFFVHMGQSMTDFLIRSDKPAGNTRLDFSLGYIPEGFTLVNTLDDRGVKMEVYEDGKGNDFSFALNYYTNGIKYSIDTENAVVTEATYQGKRMALAQKDSYLIITIFDIDHSTVWDFIGTLDQQQAMKIIDNANIK